MARRGRNRRLDLESWYWQLIMSGMGTVEACEIVEIGRGARRPMPAAGNESPGAG